MNAGQLILRKRSNTLNHRNITKDNNKGKLKTGLHTANKMNGLRDTLFPFVMLIAWTVDDSVLFSGWSQGWLLRAGYPDVCQSSGVLCNLVKLP